MERRIGKGTVSVLAMVLGLLAGERSGWATMIGGTDFNIAYWAGTGAKQAVMVVDFAATGGQSHSFGFRWDGTATGYDMVQAVAAAGDFDFSATTFPGFGTYIDNFSYVGDVGNVDNYWQYFIGTPAGGGVTWTSASIGMCDRVLTDGSVDGWYNSFDAGVRPHLPEPATALLLTGALFFWRRSRAN